MSLKSDNRPLYLLVIDKIKQDIEQGVYKSGTKLPSEYELAKNLGVSRVTLREALRMLEDENLVMRKHGIGTFVNIPPLFTSGIEELYSITQMINKNKQKAGTIFVNSGFKNVSNTDIKTFKLDNSDRVLRIERIRTADEEPVVYCIDKIPENILPKDFNFKEDGSLFKSLEKQANINITYAISDIEPLGYHEKISPLLLSPPGTSLLILKQSHFDEKERLVLYSINYFRADKFRFQVVRKR